MIIYIGSLSCFTSVAMEGPLRSQGNSYIKNLSSMLTLRKLCEKTRVYDEGYKSMIEGGYTYLEI